MSKKDLYIFGKKLGLNKSDIESILNYVSVTDEQAYLSSGPNYGGMLYGTVSPYYFYSKLSELT